MAVLLLVMELAVTGAVAMQAFQEEPRYTEVNPAGSAVLACRVWNLRGACSWQKDGLPQGIFTGKYEWAGDREAGDCSVRVLDVSPVDGGAWECQVTASAFSAGDALASPPAQLVVRVAPEEPYLEVGGVRVARGRNFTVREGAPATLKCVARNGNPPARVRWFLGSTQLPPTSSATTNTSEPASPALHRTVSTLHTTYDRPHHGQRVRCEVLHEALEGRSTHVAVRLDVQYAPTVTIQGVPTGDIEEGVDSVSLRCLADANPEPKVIWRRASQQNIFSFSDSVQFAPLNRRHSDSYTCEATNAVGAGDPVTVEIDVKYPPFNIEIGPGTFVTSNLHNSTKLECDAGGNPKPSYTWLQRVEGSERAQVRGHNATLALPSVTYGHQGSYICVATNSIKGAERRLQSEPLRLEVMGAPEVLRYSLRPEVMVQRGEDALLQMVFCADPQPSGAMWQWGSTRLAAGSGRGRHVAEMLHKVDANAGQADCYAARLLVQQTTAADARSYSFTVENDRGVDQYAVALAVREPVSPNALFGMVGACALVLVLVFICILVAYRTRKCCFFREGNLKTSDLESRTDQKTTDQMTDFTTGNGNGNGTSAITVSSDKFDEDYKR